MPGNFVFTRTLLRWPCIRTYLLVPDPGRSCAAGSFCRWSKPTTALGLFSGVLVQPIAVVGVRLALMAAPDRARRRQVLKAALRYAQVGGGLVHVHPGREGNPRLGDAAG